MDSTFYCFHLWDFVVTTSHVIHTLIADIFTRIRIVDACDKYIPLIPNEYKVKVIIRSRSSLLIYL